SNLITRRSRKFEKSDNGTPCQTRSAISQTSSITPAVATVSNAFLPSSVLFMRVGADPRLCAAYPCANLAPSCDRLEHPLDGRNRFDGPRTPRNDVRSLHRLELAKQSVCDQLVCQCVGMRVGGRDPKLGTLVPCQCRQHVDEFHAVFVGRAPHPRGDVS